MDFDTVDEPHRYSAHDVKYLRKIRTLLLDSSSAVFFFYHGATTPQWAKASSLSRFHDHTRLDTPHSVGLLWTSDHSPTQRPLPDNTQHSQETDIHAPGEIRTHNPSKRAAADQRLRPRGHWDRHQLFIDLKKARDSVRRGVLCKLTECCMPVKLVTLIRMFCATYSKVKIDTDKEVVWAPESV